MPGIFDGLKEKIKIVSFGSENITTVEANLEEVKQEKSNLSKVKENIKSIIKNTYYKFAGPERVNEKYLQDYVAEQEKRETELAQEIVNVEEKIQEEAVKISEQLDNDPLTASYGEANKMQQQYEKLNEELSKVGENKIVAEERIQKIEIEQAEIEQQNAVAADVQNIMAEEAAIQQEEPEKNPFDEINEAIKNITNNISNEMLNEIVGIFDAKMAEMKKQIEQQYAKGLTETADKYLKVIETQKQEQSELIAKHNIEIEKMKIENNTLEQNLNAKMRTLQVEADNLKVLNTSYQEKNNEQLITISNQNSKIAQLEETLGAKDKEIAVRDTTIEQKNREIETLLPYKNTVEGMRNAMNSIPSNTEEPVVVETAVQKTL